jgi:hypothetical protein
MASVEGDVLGASEVTGALGAGVLGVEPVAVVSSLLQPVRAMPAAASRATTDFVRRVRVDTWCSLVGCTRWAFRVTGP